MSVLTNCILCVTIIIISTTCLVTAKRQLPANLVKCSKSSPQKERDECIRRSIRDLLPYLASGIPEMKLPGIDPITLPIIRLEAPRMLTEFFNCTVLNAGQMNIKHVHMDLEENSLSVNFFVPSLNISTLYKLKGNLLFELNSAGNALGYFENIEAHLKMKGESVKKNGRTFIDFNDNKNGLKMEIEKIRMVFDNLFENNTELTERTNQLINENMSEVRHEILPLVEDFVGSFIFKMVQQVFKTFSTDELFLK